MRKAFIILTGVLFTLLFTACEQFHANMEDYLGYWSAEVTLARYSIDKPQQTNGEGVLYISSATDVTITIKLNNPKSVKLVTPTSSADAGKVIRFPGFKPNEQPEYGDTKDYTLKQTANDKLELTYHSAFLKKHEWGESDISPQITLIADDGRVFKQTFTVKLKVNTPPPLPVFTVAKTVGTSAHYVLCIRVPEMNMAVEGGLLHKDLARIEVNGTPYTFSVNEAGHTFVKPEADVFITQFAVERLSGAEGDELPTGKWVLYYKTDVEVKEGAAKKDYTIKLIDEKGLTSGIVNASTKPNKAETEIVSIMKGTKISGSGSETDPFIIAVAANSEGAELAISSATANTMVHCTCTDTSGGSVTRYNGNPVTVPLPLNGAGEKKYKLEYYTDGEGFAATPVKTVYYKVVEEHTVTFNVVGGNGNLEGKYGSDQQTATTSPVTLTVPHGYSVIFTATPTDPTHYKVGDWTCTPSEGFTGASGQSSATLTVTANTIVSVQFVQLNALNLSKLEIHGRDASAGSVTLPYTITQVAKSNVTLEFSGYSTIPFTVTSSPPLPLTLMPGAPKDITITVAANPGNYPEWSKTVHITRAKNNVAKLQSFTLNGETKTAASDGSFAGEYEVASKQAEVKDFIFDADSTGATASVNHAGNQTIPAGTGGQFTITVKAQNGTETQTITFTVKRKKYDVNYSVDGVGGKIKTSSGTAVTSGSTKVEYGESISFTAVPNTANGYEVKEWTVNSNVVSDYTSTSYELPDVTGDKDVKVKFKKTVYNVTFSVDGGHGTISATPQDGSASSTSPVSVEHEKKVTFTAVPDPGYEVDSWTVDGNVVSGNTSRSYELSAVTEAKTVTVKFYQSEIDGTDPMAWSALLNVVSNAPDGATLKISGTITATNNGSGNTANWGEIEIDKNLTIEAKSGTATLDANASVLGANAHRIFKVSSGKTLTLKNLTLKNGKATGTDEQGCGGGVYSAGTLTLNNTTVKDCSAENSGGGVCVSGGTFEMQGSSKITGCTASKGGGVYVSGGTFKMQDSAIVTPSTGPDQYTAGKNDVYLESGKTITIDSTLAGTNPVARITPREYTAGHLYLTGNTNAHHLKFTVPPEKVTEDSENWNVFWYIADNGNLKAEVEDSSLLQTVINGSPNNTIIKLGNISDLKTVEIRGRIMLKADKEVTLTCPKKDQNDYKHLQVKAHASLILKGPITLQGADYGSDSQYALYVEYEGEAEIKDGVTITGFKNGNIGPVVSDGKLTMSGGEISGNKAKNGGGVYIHASWRSFTMTGGTIKGNLATEHGGGVYVNGSYNDGYPIRGQFRMTGGTIEENTADKGGGVYSQGEFTMVGGTITKNTATNDGKAIMLNYNFHWQGGEIKENRGNGSVVGGSGGNFHNDCHGTES